MTTIISSSATGTTGTGSSTYTSQIWRVWTDSSITIATTANDTWSEWNQILLTSSTSTTTSITVANWNGWVVQQEALQDERAAREAVRRQVYHQRPTAEQLEQWRQQEAARRARWEREDDERMRARERARKLLVACLSPIQREDLEAKKCFYLECHSPDGSKRRYRIDEGTHGNVKLLDDKDRVVGSYCVQPDGVPTEDAMLAQKLWLETNEDEFRRKANFSRWAA